MHGSVCNTAWATVMADRSLRAIVQRRSSAGGVGTGNGLCWHCEWVELALEWDCGWRWESGCAGTENGDVLELILGLCWNRERGCVGTVFWHWKWGYDGTVKLGSIRTLNRVVWSLRMELWRHCESRMHCEYRLCKMLRNWMRLCWDRGLDCVSTLNAGCIGTVNRLTGLCWHYKNVVCWYCECNYVVSRNGLCICAVRECIQAMNTTRKKI